MAPKQKGGGKQEPRGLADGVSYSDVDSQMGEFARNVEVNERLLQRLQQYELMLLDAASLPAVLDVLLLATREHFDENIGAISAAPLSPDELRQVSARARGRA